MRSYFTIWILAICFADSTIGAAQDEAVPAARHWYAVTVLMQNEIGPYYFYWGSSDAPPEKMAAVAANDGFITLRDLREPEGETLKKFKPWSSERHTTDTILLNSRFILSIQPLVGDPLKFGPARNDDNGATESKLTGQP